MSSNEIVVDTPHVERVAVHEPGDRAFWEDLFDNAAGSRGRHALTFGSMDDALVLVGPLGELAQRLDQARTLVSQRLDATPGAQEDALTDAWAALLTARHRYARLNARAAAWEARLLFPEATGVLFLASRDSAAVVRVRLVEVRGADGVLWSSRRERAGIADDLTVLTDRLAAALALGGPTILKVQRGAYQLDVAELAGIQPG